MRYVLVFMVLWASCAQAQALRDEVDVELFLAVDVSRSMQPFELEIQRRGYATALTSPEVQNAIASGLLGRIALTYVEWAGIYDQRVIVPWTLVASPQDTEAVAAQITANFDDSLRRTSISAALSFAAASIADNRFDGLRRVIDVSGDGPNNMGPPVTALRDTVVDQGITINGLPLMTQDDDVTSRWNIPDLDAYYTACVIGGPGAFVVPVSDWAEFEDAVRRKLVLEIAGLTPPRLWRAQAQRYNCLVGEQIWRRNRDLFAIP